jgi:hypothetical protein
MALLAVGACAAVGLWRGGDRARWFTLALGIGAWIPFVVSDAVRHSWRATVIRYQFPSLFALQLCVGLGLAWLLTSPRSAARRFGIVVSVLLMLCGLTSGIRHARAGNWWNKYGTGRIVEVAGRANAAVSPLVLASQVDGHGRGNALALAHLLAGHVRVQYFTEPLSPDVPADGDRVLAWGLTESARDRLGDAGWQFVPLDTEDLYRLK